MPPSNNLCILVTFCFTVEHWNESQTELNSNLSSDTCERQWLASKPRFLVCNNTCLTGLLGGASGWCTQKHLSWSMCPVDATWINLSSARVWLTVFASYRYVWSVFNELPTMCWTLCSITFNQHHILMRLAVQNWGFTKLEQIDQQTQKTNSKHMRCGK